jgi:hypothetical protein
LIAFVMLLDACATTPAKVQKWQLGKASRADAVITLTLDYDPKKGARFHPQRPQQLAVQKCAVWGYKGAQPFGQAQDACIARNRNGCARKQLAMQYQCEGAPNP